MTKQKSNSAQLIGRKLSREELSKISGGNDQTCGWFNDIFLLQPVGEQGKCCRDLTCIPEGNPEQEVCA
ncbi:hypothetical protein [Pedobacter africanus]|uniref:Uncharacterized protein n=1 Tax=Pedobacter africanus TaxID=151894 RepID=A0A1W1ZW43_9SPHI|nr:hypothetical protein [Pedobacter africanus]SMC52341.1 hypothetical protein SAMN04488524_1006 [Pedobacter africanus]